MYVFVKSSFFDIRKVKPGELQRHTVSQTIASPKPFLSVTAMAIVRIPILFGQSLKRSDTQTTDPPLIPAFRH
jgi:hypothetical protein